MAKKQKDKRLKLFTKGSNDYIIIIVVMLLLSLGIIMVLSASAPVSLSESGDSYKYVVKQAVAAGIGLAAMLVVSAVNYNIYRKFKWIIYFGLVGLLILVSFSGLDAGGARRWINIAGFNFQPSELGKVGFIVFFAALLSDVKEKNKIKDIRYGFILPIVFLIPIVFAIYLLQNHFSATAIIVAVTCVQMFVAGTRLLYFIMAGVLGVTGYLGYTAYKNSIVVENATEGFRATRIKTWLDPFSDPTGDGWQIIQSLYAIGSGGLFGLGLRRE